MSAPPQSAALSRCSEHCLGGRQISPTREAEMVPTADSSPLPGLREQDTVGIVDVKLELEPMHLVFSIEIDVKPNLERNLV